MEQVTHDILAESGEWMDQTGNQEEMLYRYQDKLYSQVTDVNTGNEEEMLYRYEGKLYSQVTDL